MARGHTWPRHQVPEVSFRVAHTVATLKLERPDKRNAVTGPMWQAISAELAAAAQRTEIRLLVVEGSGGSFCAGADLNEVRGTKDVSAAEFRALVDRALTAIAEFPAPSVAFIEGPCIGAGCSIALACDLRFAHRSAQFRIPSARHGLLYDDRSLRRLVQLIGPSAAGLMLFAADTVAAERAQQLGLVDLCTDDPGRLLADFSAKIELGNRQTIAQTRDALRRTEEGARLI